MMVTSNDGDDCDRPDIVPWQDHLGNLATTRLIVP
jgi:hypothetical protein